MLQQLRDLGQKESFILWAVLLEVFGCWGFGDAREGFYSMLDFWGVVWFKVFWGFKVLVF